MFAETHGPEALQGLPKGSKEQQPHGRQSELVSPVFIKARSSCPRLRAGRKRPGPGGPCVRGPCPEGQHGASPPCPWPSLRLLSRRERRETGTRTPALLATPPHPSPGRANPFHHHPGPFPTHRLLCLLLPAPGSSAAGSRAPGPRLH